MEWNEMGQNWREVSRGCADAGHVMMTVVVMLLSEKRGQWIVDRLTELGEVRGTGAECDIVIRFCRCGGGG